MVLSYCWPVQGTLALEWMAPMDDSATIETAIASRPGKSISYSWKQPWKAVGFGGHGSEGVMTDELPPSRRKPLKKTLPHGIFATLSPNWHVQPVFCQKSCRDGTTGGRLGDGC